MRSRLFVALALLVLTVALAGGGAAGSAAGGTPQDDHVGATDATSAALHITDLNFETRTVRFEWQFPQVGDDDSGRDDHDRDGRSSQQRYADIQARWGIGRAPSGNWQSLGSAADSVTVPGISPGDTVSVELRGVDGHGRVTSIASGSFVLPSGDTLDSVSCVSDIQWPDPFAGAKVDRKDAGDAGRRHMTLEQRSRTVVLRTHRGTVSIPRDVRRRVQLVTPSGARVGIGIPRASRAQNGHLVAPGALSWRTGTTTTVAAALPSAASNPCIPAVDNTALLFEPDVPSLGAGVEVLTVIPDATAPTEYDFPVTVPPGGSIIPYSNGFAVTDSTGTPIVGVDPPVATDADGTEVDVTATLSGDTLHVDVDHPGHGYAYPIVLDPEYRILTPADAFDPATVDPNTLLPVHSGQIQLQTVNPRIAGCSVRWDYDLPARARTNALTATIYSGFDPVADCHFSLKAAAKQVTIVMCVEAQHPDGTWPVGCNHKPEVERLSVGNVLRKAPTPVPCTRYSWYRIWGSVEGTAELPNGTVFEFKPSVGVIPNSQFRCLPIPQWAVSHILQPDRTQKGKPSGWHYRAGQTPPNVDLVACSAVERHIYGCDWSFRNETATSYSTFFPDDWSLTTLGRELANSYYLATFTGDFWESPRVRGYGWRIAGFLQRGDPDYVSTAYPNERFAVGKKRKIKIASECPAPASAPPPANDSITSAQVVDPLIPIFEESIPGTLSGATAETGEVAQVAAAGGPTPCRSVWYSWTPDHDQLASVGVTADDPSATPPAVAVWTIGAPNSSGFPTLQLVSATWHPDGINFDAVMGVQYLVQVSSVPNEAVPAGSFEIRWECFCA